MEKRVDFERLRTMEDVLRERLRLRYEIRQREHQLKNDYSRVCEVFSADYWINIIRAKTAVVVEDITTRVASRIRGFASTFGMVGELFSGITGRFCKPSRSQTVYFEQDNDEDMLFYELDEEAMDVPPAQSENSVSC